MAPSVSVKSAVRIGYGQFAVRFGAWQENAESITAIAAACADADLLVLPELVFTGYDFPDRGTALAASEGFGDGPSCALIADLARRHGTCIVAGYAERDGDACYNAAILARPDGSLENYRKIHLFNREQELFTPGDAPPPVFDTPAGRIGVMICFDWFFPETARCLALSGAQIIAHPSNLVLPWAQRAMFARCIENHVFAVTANRIGTETQAGRSLTFTGASQILDPLGATLAAAPADQPDTATVSVDPGVADDKRIAERNHRFDDRRIALYSRLWEQP